MTGPKISEDGHWMWDGSNWVPNPHLSQITPPINVVEMDLESQNFTGGVSREHKKMKGVSTRGLVIISSAVFIVSIIVGAVFFFVFNTNPIVNEWLTNDELYWEFKKDGTLDMMSNESSVWALEGMENCSISTTWEQGSLEWELILDFKWYCPGAEGLEMKMMSHYALTNKNTILWVKGMAIWVPNDSGGEWDYDAGDEECEILLRKDLGQLYENNYVLGKAAASASDSKPNWC